MPRKKPELSSAGLHVLAMLFMLCDHIWVTGLGKGLWLTCVGRLAFPIYAFLLVEGYFHTGSLRKYIGRLLLAAMISEIPFNLMSEGAFWYSGHQNVIWTFLISLLVIHCNERVKERSVEIRLVTLLLTLLAGFVLALFFKVDYGYGGVFTVFTFYLLRGRNWKVRLGQLFLLAYINLEILEGVCCQVTLFGSVFDFPCQIFALLALGLIWMYRGRQGCHSKLFQCVCYGFYPVHLWILGLIS